MSEKGFKKSHKFTVKNIPGGMSDTIVKTLDQLLKENPDNLVIDAGTTDLANNVKSLNNIKKIVKQISREAPSINLTFLSIILSKDNQKLDKILSETNVHLKNYYFQKTIGFIDNKNIESHVWEKKQSLP